MTRQKELGAFYTPRNIARFLVRWAVRDKNDLVLDPGFGTGVFLEETFRHLIKLGVTPEKATKQIYGVELDSESFIKATEFFNCLSEAKVPHLYNQNFFEVPPRSDSFPFTSQIPRVHAVVGNPPYVRYQLFKGKARRKALDAVRQTGVKLTELTSSWAPYLIHATQFLRNDGRLGMVIPAELIQVNYVDSLRRWLLTTFSDISIIMFDERVFPKVLEDVMLLMADRTGPMKGLFVTKLKSERDLEKIGVQLIRFPKVKPSKPGGKWTHLLLKIDEYATYAKLTKRTDTIQLSRKAGVDIGVVTGANDYFLLSRADVNDWDIEERFLVPAVRKAAHIPGVIFTKEDWKELFDGDKKCLLLSANIPSEQAKKYNLWKYLEYGEGLNIKKRYKIRIRSPWYGVPYVKVPDMFLTYMSGNMPRIVLNEAEAVNTNTIHSVFTKETHKNALISSFYNTFTMLSAELVGRSYGGGVLKLEPTEAEAVMIIDVQDESLVRELETKFPILDRFLRKKMCEDALEVIDELLLEGYLALKPRTVELLRSAYTSIKRRRLVKMGKLISYRQQ